MKKTMVFGLLVLLAFVPQRANAAKSTLMTESDGVSVGYDNGFVLSVGDEFKLNFSAYMQLQHILRDNDAADNVNTFKVAKGRLRWSGFMYNPKFTYLIQLEVADPNKDDGTKDTSLKDAWLNVRHYKNMQVKIGQYFVPFNRQQTTFFAVLQFVDTSFVSKKFNANQTNPRDIGIMVSGEHQKFGYSVGIFNGNGINRAAENNNSQMLTVGRVRYNPFGKMPTSESDIAHTATPLLTLGASAAFDAGNEDGVSGSADTYGLEVVFKHQGKSAQAEYFHRDVDNNPKDKGLYIQGGLFLVPKKVEVVARYGTFMAGQDNQDEDELTAGVNFFFAGHKRKLQIDVSQISKEAGDTDDLLVRTQYQIAF